MEEDSRIMKGGGFNIIGRLGKAVFGFLITICLARLLEPYDFGLLNIGMAMITVFYVLSDVGMSQSALFYVPRFMGSGDRGKVKGVLNFTFKRILVASFLSSVLFFVSSDLISVYVYHTTELGQLFRIFSLALFFQTAFIFLKLLFQAFKHMKYYMLVDIILGMAKFLSVLLIILGFGVLGAYWGFTISYFLVLLFCIYIYRTKIRVPESSQKIEEGPVWRLAGSFFVLGLLGLLFGGLTNTFIGYLLDPTNVAYFSISLTISSLLVIVPQSLGDSLQPSISESLGSRSEIDKTIGRVMKYSAFLTIPAAGGLILLRDSIIRFLYGPSYIGASGIMVPVVLGMCIMGCFWAFVPLVYGTGKVRIELESNILKAVINVLLCFLLIPVVGVIGAGLAQLSVIFAGFLYIGTKIRKHVTFEMPWNSIFKSVISTCIMLFVLSAMQWLWGGWVKLLLLTVIGLSVYLCLMYVMRDIDETDVRFVKAILRRLNRW